MKSTICSGIVQTPRTHKAWKFIELDNLPRVRVQLIYRVHSILQIFSDYTTESEVWNVNLARPSNFCRMDLTRLPWGVIVHGNQLFSSKRSTDPLGNPGKEGIPINACVFLMHQLGHLTAQHCKPNINAHKGMSRIYIHTGLDSVASRFSQSCKRVERESVRYADQ
ncbi:hypothetical protein BDR03DRAFT_947443 [Suillus americanus]|nr:hypothetical protein BDR03DRAFT_947443 [Suillus americanus]